VGIRVFSTIVIVLIENSQDDNCGNNQAWSPPGGSRWDSSPDFPPRLDGGKVNVLRAMCSSSARNFEHSFAPLASRGFFLAGTSRQEGRWFEINNETLCEPHHAHSSQIFIPPKWRLQMRKHISFTIGATIMGLAMAFWLAAAAIETSAHVAGPTLYSSSPLPNPYLRVHAFQPVY
jgi:hypothetical protein